MVKLVSHIDTNSYEAEQANPCHVLDEIKVIFFSMQIPI